MKRVNQKLFSGWEVREDERSDAAALTCCVETAPQIATQKEIVLFYKKQMKIYN